MLAIEVTVAGKDSGWASMAPLELDSLLIPFEPDDAERKDIFVVF